MLKQFMKQFMTQYDTFCDVFYYVYKQLMDDMGMTNLHGMSYWKNLTDKWTIDYKE
jgi:hypothetical protein